MEKIFCGSARVIKGKFGDITKLNLSKEDIRKIAKYMTDEKLDYVNIEVKAKKECEQGKPTHYLQIDTWKPEPKKSNDDPFDL